MAIFQNNNNNDNNIKKKIIRKGPLFLWIVYIKKKETNYSLNQENRVSLLSAKTFYDFLLKEKYSKYNNLKHFDFKL